MLFKDNYSESNRNILKPNRYLLHPMSLSPMALNVFSLLIMAVKNDFYDKFYNHNDIDKQIDILDSEMMIKEKISTSYSITNDEMMKLTGLPLRSLKRQIVINDKTNKPITRSNSSNIIRDKISETKNNKKVYDIYLSCCELNTSLLTIHNDNGESETTTVITSSSYNGEVLNLTINEKVAFELIEYSRNKGFTKYDAKCYFSLKTAPQKKLFELATRAKSFYNNPISLFEYFDSVCLNEDLDKTIAYRVQKYLNRPLKRLIADHEKWSFGSDNIGYEIANEKGTKGSGVRNNPIDGATKFRFTFIKNKDEFKKVEDELFSSEDEIKGNKESNNLFYENDKLKSAQQTFRLLGVDETVSRENAQNLINQIGYLLTMEDYGYNQKVINAATMIINE